MRALPPIVLEVRVPDSFSPSALGTSGACRLKLIAASLSRVDWTERLASGPEAAIGTLLHRTLERAHREPLSKAEEIFDEEYERTVAELRVDSQRAHFADLASVKQRAEWSRIRAWVITCARSIRPTATGDARIRMLRDDRLKVTSGAEIPLHSKPLRMRGRADQIRRLGDGIFEIRDYKMGNIIEKDGAIKPEIVLQLRAYGLMLLEQHPDAQIRLVVDDGTNREVAFDESARRTAKEEIERITASMPPSGLAGTDALTQPGNCCYGCSIRHVCPGYRTAAPRWWAHYPQEIAHISNDIWGMVMEVHGSETVDVVLQDDAGRRVRVSRLDARHGLSAVSVGSRLWFFGLESPGASRGFDGTRLHPRTFYELPRDRTERRAWAVRVFVEQKKRSWV